MFKGIHNFIHLNLAIALSLALLVFVSGIEGALNNEVSFGVINHGKNFKLNLQGACTTVAILLHYFFTAGFTWMLCEGIMLYYKLIKVFNTGFIPKRRHYMLFGWCKYFSQLL